MKKKLVFKKATLRQLTPLTHAELGRVAGGKTAPGEEEALLPSPEELKKKATGAEG